MDMSNLTPGKAHPPVVQAMAVVGELQTEGDDDHHDGNPPAHGGVFEAHVARVQQAARARAVERHPLHHHPGEGRHEQEVQQRRHRLARHLAVVDGR